jgi:hypothetical protein
MANSSLVSEAPNPEDEDPLNYHQEYCRLYLTNVILATQMKELLN